MATVARRPAAGDAAPCRPGPTSATTSGSMAIGRRQHPRRGPVVTGEQDRGQPERAQPAHGLRGARPDRVGHLEHGPRDPVPGHRDGRAPAAWTCRRRRPARRACDPVLGEQRDAPDQRRVRDHRGRRRSRRARDHRAPRARGSRRTPRRRAARRTGPRGVGHHGADAVAPGAPPASRPAGRDRTGEAQRLVGVDPVGGVHRLQRRTPVVSVPVRHSTTVSTRAARPTPPRAVEAGRRAGSPARCRRAARSRGAADARGQATSSTAPAAPRAGAGPAPAPSQNPSVATARATTTATTRRPTAR